MKMSSKNFDRVCLCLIIAALSLVDLSSAAGDSDLEQVKNRRAGGGGTVGLFAFPRVGRRDPSMRAPSYWDNSLPTSFEEYEEFPQPIEMKRANLIAFPRVGRSELRNMARLAAWQEQNKDKRTGPSANSGLWFGPRLGRVQKRSSNTDDQKGDHF